MGRHTTFFPLRDNKTIMAFGGKNSNIDGWMPFTKSVDGGTSFAKGLPLPFPALGGNQRPCVHRLASGNLVFVGDAQVKGSGKQPKGWKHGTGVYAAISTDDAKTWTIRMLPIGPDPSPLALSTPHSSQQVACRY